MNRATRLFSLILLGAFAITPAEARTVRVVTVNIKYGPPSLGTRNYEALKAVLGRVDADIVAFQEIFNNGSTNRIPNWRRMAEELGYEHKMVAEENGARAGHLYLGYYSRFPLQAFSVNSPAPASEMSRLPMRAVVQVPGAAKPLVLWNMHHKAGSTTADQFRRAVEAHRIVEDVDAHRAAYPAHNEFVVLGDLNDDAWAASSQQERFVDTDFVDIGGSGTLPPGYVLGQDLATLLQQSSLPYRTFPDQRYAPAGQGLHRLDLRQLDGGSRMTIGNRTLDYILVSTALWDSAVGLPRGEIYNSIRNDQEGGLAKFGPSLASRMSRDASDHLAVFADLEMQDAPASASVTSFDPVSGVPGSTVTIHGAMLHEVDAVRFGGVAADFSVVSPDTIIATVPVGASSGPITMRGAGELKACSLRSFQIEVLPTVARLESAPSAVTGFAAAAGAVSAAQPVAISAVGLPGPLRAAAPVGFEVSLDGANYSPAVQVAAPVRSDSSANYIGPWTNGSTGGRGFRPWTFVADNGRGTASAYLGNPGESGLTGMGSRAFALRAELPGSGAFADAIRALQHPLAVGEALSFDWGINWDSNDNIGEKGFAIKSGRAIVLSIRQANFPGPIVLNHGTNEVSTGLDHGTAPMRWTFRQVNAQTLNVSATGRDGRTNVAYSTNVTLPGAVSGFMWFASQMQEDARRRSYYDNLSIEPAGIGGGAIEGAMLHVRLAANAPSGAVSGELALSSAGQSLGSVAVSGDVTTNTPYDSWAQSHGLDPLGNGDRTADPDNDGHNNLREFLFGALPTEPTGSLWRHELQPSGLVLTFVGRQTGVSYKLMSTGNLTAGTWSEESLDITEAANQNGVSEGYQRRQIIVPSPSGNRFFRLQAVESPP